MLYAVIDTNVIVSALMNIDSVPGLVIKQALMGSIIPVLHDYIVSEYMEVLQRKKFGFPQNFIDTVIIRLKSRGVFVEAADVNISMPDPKDEIFYATALTAREYIDIDTCIITGNMKHFPQVSFAVTPREALNLLLLGG